MPKDLILLLEGGAALGAYQCGAYRALVPYLSSGEYRLRAVLGASIGAINAGVVVRHHSDADAGAGALERFWRELAVQPLPFVPVPAPLWHSLNGHLTGLLLGNPRIYLTQPIAWSPLGLLAPALFPLMNIDPLRLTMARAVGDYASGSAEAPLLGVQAMEVVSGRPRMFVSDREPIRPQHYQASASIPILFAPQKLGDHHYNDGSIAPDTLLPALSRLLRERPGWLRDGECVVVQINLFRRESRLPVSLLDHLWRLIALFLGGRLELDAAATDMVNRHLEFVREAGALARDLPRSRLTRLIEREAAALAGAGETGLRVVPVARAELPEDPLSSIFDFSPRRIDTLIAQGEAEASEVFRQLLAAQPGADAREHAARTA